MQILAIIGARSGSQSVPHKNIRRFAGKPLLTWAIECAKSSQYITRVIVATDSERYAAIARSAGADVPFLLPASVTTPRSSEMDFIGHTLQWLNNQEQYVPDIVVRIFATTPLQRICDIDRGIGIVLEDQTADSCVIITESHEPPYKALRKTDDADHVVTYITEKGEDVTPLQRQRYTPAFTRQGKAIIARKSTIDGGSLTGRNVRYVEVPREYALDIDTEMDFAIAEQVHHQLMRGDAAHSHLLTAEQVNAVLMQTMKEGKRLLEPFATEAQEKRLPFKILEDVQVSNAAEVHVQEGDLWYCLQGEVEFECGGKLVNPRAKQYQDGSFDANELIGDRIEGGSTTVLRAHDWLWIPANVPHRHSANNVARLMIIKIPHG